MFFAIIATHQLCEGNIYSVGRKTFSSCNSTHFYTSVSPEKHHTETTVTRAAVLMTNFSFWIAEAWLPLSSQSGGFFLKRTMKSPLHSLSRVQKRRLIFSVRFQFMKGRTSLADVLCFHQADSYLLGFICLQISTMWQKYILQLYRQADQILRQSNIQQSFVDGVQTAKLHISQSEITLSPTLL